MKAIVQDRYGSADVLDVRDVARPEVGPADVLVKVVAAGVDLGAWHFMTGRPYLMRILGFGLRAPRTRVPGTNHHRGRVARRARQHSDHAEPRGGPGPARRHAPSRS